MDETTPREKIGQGRFKDAAAARDPTPVLKRLTAIGVDADRVSELAGLVRRAGSLIHQRPEPTAQKVRDHFLATLREALETTAPSVDLSDFDDAVASVQIAEDGYLRILATLDRCAISKRPLANRLSAAIARAEQRLGEIRALIEAALLGGAEIIIPGGVALTDADGRPLSADALITSVVIGLGGALKMEAYHAKLFAKAGWVELPTLPPATPEDINLFTPSEILGMSWQRWERFHQHARFSDQTIAALSGSALPGGCPPQITEVFTRASDANFVDWAGNERALDREGISHRDLTVTTNVGTRAKGISGTVAALPTEWITSEEVGQCLSLSEAVGFNIADETVRYGGLALTQWVRGYTALAAWADSKNGAAPGVLRTNRQDLVDLLVQVSFTEAEADTFLAAASFGRTSRDLFDAPIVRTKSDWLVIGPAVASQRLAKIIPSMLASKDIQIQRKGSAFELRVVAFLREQGLDARAVTAWRENAEYQYDVLVPWGGRLLLIECKNHGLSGNDPVQAYHFLQGLQEDIEQVQRLQGGLANWPEIVTDTFGPKAVGLEVTPILLQNETFSVPGPIDGIHIYDWSALKRFFEDGWFRVSHDHQVAEGFTIRNRVAIKQIWTGDTPAVDDLMAELAAPHQLTVLDHHSEVVESVFYLDEQTLARDWSIVRLPATVQSLAVACGASPEGVAKALKDVDDQIAAGKKKLAAKMKAKPAAKQRGKRRKRI